MTVLTPETFKPKLAEANDGEMTIPIIIKPVSIENQDVRWVLVKKGLLAVIINRSGVLFMIVSNACNS